MSRLARVREAAIRNRKQSFTALLHHLTPKLLEQSFYELKRMAAEGVDGVSWRDYEEDLDNRLVDLHRRIHDGRYRPRPARRVYIPKADGSQRPLSILSIEDKIAQQAVVSKRPAKAVLTQRLLISSMQMCSASIWMRRQRQSG